MKNLFRVIIFLIIGLLFTACGPSVTATPSATPSPAATVTATFTPIPSLTATATVEPTSRPEFVPPTLIPTIDPTLVPGLLSKAFSVQTMKSVNGHTMREITGWDYGLGGGYWTNHCDGYYWLDASHLLLYPAAGKVNIQGYMGVSVEVNVVPQPVVINFENRDVWLPPINTSSSRECRRVYWSQELQILITYEYQGDLPSISTYTADGRRLASYQGRLLDVSPRGTKILASEDTLIDLGTNKTIKLNWSMEDYNEPHLSYLYWTYPEETRVYRCCYFYADISSGFSHRFQRSDFQDANGNYLDSIGLWFHQGEWVRDNEYFLVSWLAVDDGPVRYLPMFDPATKLFYDVMEMAGLPDDWEAVQTTTSLDGNYVLLKGWEDSYLVNLITFEAQYYAYPDLAYDIDIWSPDSKFIWFQSHDSKNESTEFQILSISDRKLSPLPLTPSPDANRWWHPANAVIVYPSTENTLIFLDAATMSYQELPFVLQDPPYFYGNTAWHPNGEKIAMVAEDGSIWQVDYPKLENLEQLTPSLPNVHDVYWSPDGISLAFISGSDIYIVETTK